MDATRFDVWRLARKGKKKTPGPPVTSEENGIRFVELADVVIRARLVGNPSSDRVVVLCPDPPNVIEHYDELIALLAPYVKVLCFELPGFGFSYPKPAFDFDLETIARCVIELLVDKLGVRKATLAFPCLTSMVALAVARKKPDLVERLVLAQAAGHHDACAWMERVDQLGLRTPWIGQLVTFAAPKAIARLWYRAAVATEDDVDRFSQPALEALKNGASFCLASAFQSFIGVDARKLSAGSIPTVVIWGESDRTHGPTDRSSIKTHVTSPQIVRFFGNGHFPDLESPLRFAQGILGHEIDQEIAARVAVVVAAQAQARLEAKKKKKGKKEQPAAPPVPETVAAPAPVPQPPPMLQQEDPDSVFRTRVTTLPPEPARTLVQPLPPPVPTRAPPPQPPPQQPAAPSSWLSPTPQPAPELPQSWTTPVSLGQTSAPFDPESSAGFDPLPAAPRSSFTPTVVVPAPMPAPMPVWPSKPNGAPEPLMLDSLSVEPIDEPAAPPPPPGLQALELDAPRSPRRPTPSRITRPSGSRVTAEARPRAPRSRAGRISPLHALLFVVLDVAAISTLAMLAAGVDLKSLPATFLPPEGIAGAALLSRPASPIILVTALLVPFAVLAIARSAGVIRLLFGTFALAIVAVCAVVLATMASCPLARVTESSYLLGAALDACRVDTAARLAVITGPRAVALIAGGGAVLGLLNAIVGPRARR